MKTYDTPKPFVAKVRSPSIGKRFVPTIKEPELPKIPEVKEETSIIEVTPIKPYHKTLEVAPIVSVVEIKKEVPVVKEPIQFNNDYKPNVKHHDF